MRKYVVMLALLLFILYMNSVSQAASGILLTGEEAKAVADILPWLVTNPQGEERNGKTAYIIGGLRCPCTAVAINKSPQITEIVQIKWLFPKSEKFSIPSTGFIMTEALPDAFMQVSNGVRKQDTDFQKFSAGMNALLAYVLGQKTGINAYPTLIYNTTGGVRVTTLPDDLIQEKDDIIPFTYTERNPSDLRAMVEKVSQFQLRNNPRYENHTQKVLPSFVLPDMASPSLDNLGFALEPGYWRPCAEYNTDFYICVTPDKFTYFLHKSK